MSDHPAYERALFCGKKLGLAAPDAAKMALFCEGSLQAVVGAASPVLVWEGAQKKNMTYRELVDLAADDPIAVHELMWL